MLRNDLSCRSYRPCQAVLFAALFGASSPHAQAATDPSALCDAAAGVAAATFDVPLNILLAITRAETGRVLGDAFQPWPWAINRAGDGTWYDDATQAIAAAETAIQEGAQNFDVGCFQLNHHWHGAAFASLREMFDPQQNADYAARFLTDLYRQEGDWAIAVAAYHSRSAKEGSSYLARVEEILASLDQSDPGFDVAETQPSVARENLYPLLRSGARGTAGSIMPQQSARDPLFLASR